VLLTASQWYAQTGNASAAVYTSPGWSNADAPPLPWCTEPAPPPPDSRSEAGYWIAFSFGVRDFSRAGGSTYRP
jgi:hypothetical protein